MHEESRPRVGMIAHHGLGMAVLAAALLTCGLLVEPLRERAPDFTDRRSLKALRKAAAVDAQAPSAPQKKFRHNRRG